MYYYYWGEECRSFYRGLRYQEVCYIHRGSTVINYRLTRTNDTEHKLRRK